MNKKTSGFLLIALAIGLFIYQLVKYIMPPKVKIRQIELVTSDNVPYNIDYSNKEYVVVSFFTTWCSSCHEEFKNIQQATLNGELKNFHFIAVTDEPLEKLKKYIVRYKYQGVDFLQCKNNLSSLGVHAFPTVVVFDSNQKTVFSHIGAVDWANKEWINKNFK